VRDVVVLEVTGALSVMDTFGFIAVIKLGKRTFTLALVPAMSIAEPPNVLDT
jgi:hypothetical protein